MRKLVKTRMYKGKTIYYYDDGTKETRFWLSTDEFCNLYGID